MRPDPDAYPEVHLPAITADQMREVDRAMIDDIGIHLLQMMENAGRSLAELALARYRPMSCTVLAGSGGNGGGGLVAARHLHNRGVAVTVAPTEPEPSGRRSPAPDPATHGRADHGGGPRHRRVIG